MNKKKSHGEQQSKNQSGTFPERHDLKIMFLINSINYFLESVFIIIERHSYRLVVINDDHILTDRRYRTLKGARIAFSKFYCERRWEKKIPARWSHAYPPNPTWLKKHLF